MVILRKGKKVIMKADSAGKIADSAILEKTLESLGASPLQIENIRRAIWQNLFAFAIYGAKMRLGGGLILECEAKED